MWVMIVCCVILIVSLFMKRTERFEMTCQEIEVDGPTAACGDKGMLSELKTIPVPKDDGSTSFRSVQKCCLPGGGSEKICIGELCVYEKGWKKILKANGLLSAPASMPASAPASATAST